MGRSRAARPLIRLLPGGPGRTPARTCPPARPAATAATSAGPPPGGGRHLAYSASGPSSSSGQPHGVRARSAGGSGARPRPQSGINIPNSSGAYSSQESGGSSPEEADRERSGGGHDGTRLVIGSLPAHLSPHLFGGFKCPVCSKFVPSDEMDLHLVLCLTKPRVTYNEDVLSKDAGECAICLEELLQGDTIGRLPCLCIYHKGCIDEWFEVNRSCPEHPSD